MGHNDVPEKVLERVNGSRRSFLRKLILGSAFVVPAVTSFSMGGLGSGEAWGFVSNQVCGPFVANLGGFVGPGNSFDQRLPLPINSFTDPCTGDTVTLNSGYLHVVICSTVDRSSGIHLDFSINTEDVHGTDDDGTSYTGHANTNGTMNLTPGANECTLVVNIGLQSQGGGDNLRVKLTTHVTVDPNGNITSCVFNFAGAECVPNS